VNLIRFQFAISYAVIGALVPLLPVFFKEVKGFSNQEISFAFSLAGLGHIIAPTLLTLLADTRVDSRRIVAAATIIASGMLFSFYSCEGVTMTIVFYALYNICYTPVIPLLDGIFFAARRREEEQLNAPLTNYNSIRVWGTIGYMIPSVFFMVLIRMTSLKGSVLVSALFFCAVAIATTFFLPKPSPRIMREAAARRQLPSMEALRALFSPNARYFTIGVFLAGLATPVYYMYFPLYLKEVGGVRDNWVGIIIIIGVFFEIFYILNLERLRSILRLRGIMLVGLLAMAIRMLALAVFPCALTGILIQLVHGLEILALIVVPVMYLNRIAGDSFRNSIQGVYAMTVIGTSRILGTLIAGQFAEQNILIPFYWASFLAFTSCTILYFKFHPIKSPTPEF
jgi:PPP family 3-phenylpropionic acid transporter